MVYSLQLGDGHNIVSISKRTTFMSYVKYYSLIWVAFGLGSCQLRSKNNEYETKSPIVGLGGSPLKMYPVQYVVGPKHCSLGKVLYPNASIINNKLQENKPVWSITNNENLMLAPPADPFQAWLDVVVQETATSSELPLDRRNVFQAYQRFSANGDCPPGNDWCGIAARHLKLGTADQSAMQEISRMFEDKYAKILDKKDQEKLRQKLFLSFLEPDEMTGKNGKTYGAVLDYEKWVWKYSTPSPENWLVTSSNFYGIALSRAEALQEGQYDWVNKNDMLKKHFDFVKPDLYKVYSEFDRLSSKREFNTTFKKFDLGDVNAFYKNFNFDNNIRAKSVHGYLQAWLTNKNQQIKNHLYKAYDKEVGRIEVELKSFLESVPSYKGDLWLPMVRGNRKYANKLMLNMAEISQRSDGKFRLSELMPDLQPNRLIVGDLDPLVASEGTEFNLSPRERWSSWKPKPFPQGEFYGVLVRVKSPDIKVTYPLYQPQSGFWEIQNVRSSTSTREMGSYNLPFYSFPGFVKDGPNDFYRIERIEKINPNVTIRESNDSLYQTFESLNFDVLITVTKA